MQTEIGSNFDLDEKYLKSCSLEFNIRNFGFDGSDNVLLSSGRGAISYVLDEIERRNPILNKVALIPSFTCSTVIQPFIKKGYTIQTYDIDETLCIKIDQFKSILSKNNIQVVLMHQYFGFNTIHGLEKFIEEANDNGVIFIEDRTQCLYSEIPLLPADYIIASLRKWGPLPDGGIAVCKKGMFCKSILKKSDKRLEAVKLEASLMKHYFLYKLEGNKQDYLDKFKVAEALLNQQIDYYEISPSSLIIQANLNIEQLKLKRRTNYRRLYKALNGLNNIHIIKNYPDDRITPLYCPIFSTHRDELQFILKKNNVYAPIIWPKPLSCPDICVEAQCLYDGILCLPIDQRYDVDDMDRIIKIIKEYSKYGS